MPITAIIDRIYVQVNPATCCASKASSRSTVQSRLPITRVANGADCLVLHATARDSTGSLFPVLIGRMTHRLNGGNVRRRLLYGAIIILLASCLGSTCLAFEAELGVSFADTYSAFAPLYVFYRSYADHLFLGTDVEIPMHLAESCQSFSFRLGLLQIEMMGQTASATTGTLDLVMALRIDLSDYCVRHAAALEDIAAMSVVDSEVLATASEDGLFAGIQALSDELGSLLDAVLLSLDGDEERWRFAVSFSMRGLLNQETVERIDANLRDILYGSETAEGPPVEVPPDVKMAMAALVAASGEDLEPEEAIEAVGHAAIVLAFLLGGATNAGP